MENRRYIRDRRTQAKRWHSHNSIRDTLRICALMVVATLLLLLSKSTHLPDEMLAPLLASSAMVLYLAGFTHFVRRVLFPSLDLRDYLDLILHADTHDPVSKGMVAIAGSIVFFAMCYIIGILFQSFVAMLR